jgi:hypothetical protein
MKARNLFKVITQGICFTGAAFVAISCGGNGASNNDQGMSVTLLGLFNSSRLTLNNNAGGQQQTLGSLGCGQLPGGFAGGYLQLGEIGPEPGGTVLETGGSGTDPAGGYLSVVGIQNNLYGQAYRGERLLLDYYVPGASVQPPSTTVPIYLVAGPAESAAQTGNNAGNTVDPGLRKPLFTSLPPSLSNLCNRSLQQVTIIPPAIREWLNFNRDLLPAAPYKMELTVQVSGLTSSGNRVDTNPVTLDFDVLPESYVAGPNPSTEAGDTTTGGDATDGGTTDTGDTTALSMSDAQEIERIFSED